MAPQHSVVVRHGSNTGSLFPHGGSHAVDDPSFAPIGKLPVEILAEIFVQSLIPPCQCDGPNPKEHKLGTHPQMMIPQQLVQVCGRWKTIVNNNARIWATINLYDRFIKPEVVSLWIKNSKSHPLDVFFWRELWENQDEQRAILEMLHKELWRIRILSGDFSRSNLLTLFPPGVSSEATMLETLDLRGDEIYTEIDNFGDIHCPRLHSLSVYYFKGIDLFAKPMQNVHHLEIGYYKGPVDAYVKLFHIAPNLVSLTWREVLHESTQRFPVVYLPSLRFLTIDCGMAKMTGYLTCFLNQSPNTFSGDGIVGLRFLRLEGAIPRETMIRPILHRLKHLVTLVLNNQHYCHSVDALLLALSPLDRDRSSACPQLKTVQLKEVCFSTSVLEGFVERRVKSDLDEPAPDLVTSLVLDDDCQIEEELRAKFAQTHSSSITFNEISCRETDPETKAYRCCVKFTQ